MKLADFGLARSYGSPGRHMTPTVVTRWYRPPELCFGCREYGAAVDMWGVSVLPWYFFQLFVLVGGCYWRCSGFEWVGGWVGWWVGIFISMLRWMGLVG